MLKRLLCRTLCFTTQIALLSVYGMTQAQADQETASAFDVTIPVVDLKDFYNPETHDQFVAQVADALREVGFFAVLNSGVAPAVLERAYAATEEFFRLDLDEKMGLFDPRTNGQRGYVAGESAKGQKLADFKEFYHVGREKSKHGHYPNIWPDNFALQEPLCALYEALEMCKVPLEQAMAEAIGMPLDFLTSMTEEGDNLLRAIHYPAHPPEGQVWAAEHTDIDLFTILPKATADGLQVRNKEGEWIDVRVPENAFIVNGGDMLENLTNGEFRSGPHRVVAHHDEQERFSIVHFIHPKSSDRLDPLPQCVSRAGGMRKYANATRWELLEERLVDLGLASFEMLQDLATNGLMERLIEVGRASTKAMNRLKEAGLASDVVLEELARIEGAKK